MTNIGQFLFLTLVTVTLSIGQGRNFGEPNHRAVNVALSGLIGNPERYNDTLVRVQGIVNLAFEGNALYLTKEHWQHGVTKEAVWLSIEDNSTGANLRDFSKYNGEYVLIEGRFNSEMNGHLGLFSGSIVRINRILLWEQLEKTTNEDSLKHR